VLPDRGNWTTAGLPLQLDIVKLFSGNSIFFAGVGLFGRRFPDRPVARSPGFQIAGCRTVRWSDCGVWQPNRSIACYNADATTPPRVPKLPGTSRMLALGEPLFNTTNHSLLESKADVAGSV
jgi:hypothetical protein